jgi:hypothetical protein
MHIDNQDREFVPLVGPGEVDEGGGGACAALVRLSNESVAR